MDLNYIKELIKAVDESGVEEVEIEIEGSRLRISKNKKGEASVSSSVNSFPNYIPIPFPIYPMPGFAQTQIPAVPVAQSQPPASVEVKKEEKASVESTETTAVETGKKYHEIKSPIVGTFYRAPAPDAEPYVKVGDEVFPGTVLCIVEAMKLMNEIESDVHGRVAKILVENAQPVEYSQPLFLIELLD